jgi:hypothetical protein
VTDGSLVSESVGSSSKQSAPQSWGASEQPGAAQRVRVRMAKKARFIGCMSFGSVSLSIKPNFASKQARPELDCGLPIRAEPDMDLSTEKR